MGRGRMGNSGTGSSRGSGGFSGGGNHGRGSMGGGHHRRAGVGHRTTIFIGGGHHGVHSSGSPWVGIVVGAIFVLMGFFVMFSGFVSCGARNTYGTVQAECVLNEASTIDKGYYYSTYEYKVDGTEYKNRSMQSWEFPEEIGKVVTIYYLKSDPKKIYEEMPEDDSNSGNGVMIVVGLIFAGVGAIPLVVCIKEIKNKKNGSFDGDDSDLNKPMAKEETSKRCAYCGAKYNKNSDSCPKCGASKTD